MDIKDIIVQPSETGERIDTSLAKKTGITRSQIQRLIEKGNISVNSMQASQNYKVKSGDFIVIRIPEKETDDLIPEPIPLEILYKDRNLVVVNKPANMVVYPSAGHNQGTLMNVIAHHCHKLATIGGPLRPGVVHRLDKDTSGVMVVALDDKAYYSLTEQFRARSINRKYIALVYGNLKEDSGEISLPIGRSESDRKKMSTRIKKGKEAVTRWKVLERLENATLIEARLGTGRTHQIRVHFASIGHPVMGDRTYGKKTEIEIKKKKVIIPRQMLHAETLGFIHPATGKYIEFSSQIPEDMKKVLANMDSKFKTPD